MTLPRLAAMAVALASSVASGAETPRTLRELDPQAKANWQVTLAVDPAASYAVLRDRVAVLGADERTISFHGFDGRLLGKVRHTTKIVTLAASPMGDLLLGSTPLDEDTQRQTVFSAAGDELWTTTLGSSVGFSPSGNFLLPRFDFADASQPPTAYRAGTGEVAWTEASENPDYWHVAAAENDTLAYYRVGKLQLIDLNRGGAVLWERAVPADPRHDLGEAVISADGRIIAVRTRDSVETNEQAVTQVYDGEGRLLWERRAATGESGSGFIRGISAEGALVAMSDLGVLRILRAADGAELSRMDGPRVRAVTLFTKDVLVLAQDSATRILSLAPDGGIEDDSLVPEPVAFRRLPSPPQVAAPGASASTRYVTLTAHRAGSGLTLSEIELSPRRAPAGRRP